MSARLTQWARELAGEVSGGQVLAPGPGHSRTDRSLAIKFDPQAPDGFMVHSFAGDDWRDCRDHVRRLLGIGTDRPVVRERPVLHQHVGGNERDRTALAMAIWQEARPLDGSPAATYLFRRGVDSGALSRDLHRALRWHPACPWEGGRHGCIVGLFTDAITGEPKAIHRTAISPAGEKVGRRALGPIAGCVIRLWPDEDVLDGLVVGEGIETTLAAATRVEHRGTLLQPAWAVGFAGNIAKLPVLSGIEAITILVDNDASGTGQTAALVCSARWTAVGREVIRLVPRQAGADFNDLVEES